MPALVERMRPRISFHARHWLGRGDLPNTLIVGAVKAGTTSVFQWLSRHPEVCASWMKEPGFFDREPPPSLRWYRAQFARQRQHRVILEATPSYLPNPLVPERVKRLLPDARFMVLLRNPIDRAVSHFSMRLRWGREKASLEEAVLAELSSLAQLGEPRLNTPGPPPFSPYVARGMYGPQLERWLTVFPTSRFLFLKSEDLFRSPADGLDRLRTFLDLPVFDFGDLAPHNVGRSVPVSAAVRDRLEAAFAASNAQVLRLTGISW